jgi:four helix bundle protein
MKGRVAKFEDLIAWQKARKLTREIYELTNEGGFAKDFALRDQIRRSSVSVMSNIAEGFERVGLTEFHRFLSIAKGSCAEVRTQLYVAFDVGHMDETKFQVLMSAASEVAAIIGGLRASVKRQQNSRQ